MRRTHLIALVVAGIVLLAGLAVGVVAALAAADRESALDEHREVATTLAADIRAADDELAAAEVVLASAGDPNLPVEQIAVLSEARDAVAASVGEGGDLLAADPDELGTDEVRQAARALRAVGEALGDGEISRALRAVRDAVHERVPEVAAANVDAVNERQLQFRSAADALPVAEGPQIAPALTAYLDAARALAASTADELAEKAGPLFDARMAAQAFARELAGGVLLDFDWARLVNGYGTGGSYGGTSYWNSASGGYATITLSDSVAELWPAPGVQALVAHEVGHAILARSDCNVLFFRSEFADGGEEPWATAWAIGLGHTANGSGESVYGRPREGLIALSTECR